MLVSFSLLTTEQNCWKDMEPPHRAQCWEMDLSEGLRPMHWRAGWKEGREGGEGEGRRRRRGDEGGAGEKEGSS